MKFAIIAAALMMGGQAQALGLQDSDKEDPATSIRVPNGFTADVVADKLGRTRHMVVADNGTVYLSLRRKNSAGHGIAWLQDRDGDGRYEAQGSFFDEPGTGLGFYGGHLYFATDTVIYRMPITGNDPVPGEPEIIVEGFIDQGQHATKPMTFDNQGQMFVTVGAPSNACQKEARTPESPGLKPCPQLERQSGIWVFSATDPGQKHGKDGRRYSTGIRNALALDYDRKGEALYFSSHGRDQLSSLFPAYYSDEVSAELPAEEVHMAVDGGDYGWPFTYWDHRKGKRMAAPEYGGDGNKVAEGDYRKPIVAMPGHWAPNDMIVYHGDQFPQAYQGGLFIAFHGSWNRAPLPQKGYNIVFVPPKDGSLAADWVVFADKFKGQEPLVSPYDAEYRPMGLAVDRDGSLLVADSVEGRVWRIAYRR